MPQLHASHANALRALLSATPSHQRLLLVSTFPIRSTDKAEVSEPSRLHRLTTELDFVPARERLTPSSYTIAPYVTLESSAAAAAVAAASSTLPPLLVYARAACSSSKYASLGMRFRHAVTAGFNDTTDPAVLVRCVGGRTPGNVTLDAYLLDVRRSTFCLVLPGDLPSASRLSEVLANGCIPVFAGPPWTLLPLLPHVPYAAFSLFYRIRSTPWFLPGDADAVLPGGPGDWAEEVRTHDYIAGLGSGGRWGGVVDVDTPASVLAALRGMRKDTISRLKHAVAEWAPWFTASEGVSVGARHVLTAAAGRCTG